jgi:hypothetical protein
MGMGAVFVFVILPPDVQPTRVRRGDSPDKAK